MTDTVQLPDNWREQISHAVPFTITRLIDSWRARVDAAALPTPPAEASREEIAAELDRLVEQNREWRSTSKGFLAAERAVHDYWTTKLTRRAVELRREATDG